MSRPLAVLVALIAASVPALALADAPRVSIGDVPETVRVAEPFDLAVEVRWTGEPDAFQVVGVSIGEAPGVSRGALRQRMRAQGGEVLHSLDQSLDITVPGEHTLGPVVVTYREHGGEPLEIEVPGTFTVQALPPPSPARRLLLGAIAAAGILGAWLLRRRARIRAAAPPPPPPVTSAGERVGRCRAYIRDGDGPAALRELIALAEEVPAARDALPPREALEREEVRLRYGGFAADRHQMERWLRAVEVATRPGEPPQDAPGGSR